MIEVGQEVGIDLFLNIKEGINEQDSTLVYRIQAGGNVISADDLIGKMSKWK